MLTAATAASMPCIAALQVEKLTGIFTKVKVNQQQPLTYRLLGPWSAMLAVKNSTRKLTPKLK